MTLCTRLAVALVLASAALSSAQNTEPAPSVDPLSGSSFVPGQFTPSNTFTPVTTFPRATGGAQTVITGAGPSVAPDPFTFTYTVPTATVSGTDQSALFQSLASGGYQTATDGRGLNPNPTNLQVRTVP